MLAVLKRVRERDRHVKAGGWREPPIYGTYVGKRGDGYAGITIGIVGLGRAGSRVADLLRPWGARVLAADPYVEARLSSRATARNASISTRSCAKPTS